MVGGGGGVTGGLGGGFSRGFAELLIVGEFLGATGEFGLVGGGGRRRFLVAGGRGWIGFVGLVGLFLGELFELAGGGILARRHFVALVVFKGIGVLGRGRAATRAALGFEDDFADEFFEGGDEAEGAALGARGGFILNFGDEPGGLRHERDYLGEVIDDEGVQFHGDGEGAGFGGFFGKEFLVGGDGGVGVGPGFFGFGDGGVGEEEVLFEEGPGVGETGFVDLAAVGGGGDGFDVGQREQGRQKAAAGGSGDDDECATGQGFDGGGEIGGGEARAGDLEAGFAAASRGRAEEDDPGFVVGRSGGKGGWSEGGEDGVAAEAFAGSAEDGDGGGGEAG